MYPLLIFIHPAPTAPKNGEMGDRTPKMAPAGFRATPTKEPIRTANPPIAGPSKIPIRDPPIIPSVICPETPIVIVNGRTDKSACKAAKTAIDAILMVDNFNRTPCVDFYGSCVIFYTTLIKLFQSDIHKGSPLDIHPPKHANHISACLELAILLEASAHKPGNVSVVTNFESTRYEHFLASAVAARPSFEYAAEQGVAVSKGRISLGGAGIGQIIKNCVADINAWQHGGNTLLGTVILFSPIAVAAGMTVVDRDVEIPRLRENVKLVVESTTPEDAVNVYDAIKIAKPSGLGTVPKLDLNDPTSTNRILGEEISLYQVFRIAEKYDTVCSEWVNNYPVTFDLAYPTLTRQIRNGDDLDVAIIHTFLKVLSECPDTFIARKTSLEKSQEISSKAKQVLEFGGYNTSSGRKSLSRFDQQLRESSNLLNPGTTADIIAAALALVVLDGYRP